MEARTYEPSVSWDPDVQKVRVCTCDTAATPAFPPSITAQLLVEGTTSPACLNGLLPACSPALQYLEAALGADKLRQISEALTRPPLATCLRVNTLRTMPEVGAERGHALPGGCCMALSRAGTPTLACHSALCVSARRLLHSLHCLQELLRRLPAALTAEDAALLEQNPAYVHPLLPDAIILPGTGPHAIDYTRTGARREGLLPLSLHLLL